MICEIAVFVHDLYEAMDQGTVMAIGRALLGALVCPLLDCVRCFQAVHVSKPNMSGSAV